MPLWPLRYLRAESDPDSGVMAALYDSPIDVLGPLLRDLNLFRNGTKGGCYACEGVGIMNLELRNALIEVMLSATKNGEDCSYLIAKSALGNPAHPV